MDGWHDYRPPSGSHPFLRQGIDQFIQSFHAGLTSAGSNHHSMVSRIGPPVRQSDTFFLNYGKQLDRVKSKTHGPVRCLAHTEARSPHRIV
jgi:hypothetical protein